jgi:hypothetical protein
MLPARNRDLPPIAVSVASSNGRNAPVAWTDDDQVLPILTTSGPFPEVVAAALTLREKCFVLDGEIVVPVDGKFSFDDLLQRMICQDKDLVLLHIALPVSLSDCGENGSCSA